jgi:hypothetical protein
MSASSFVTAHIAVRQRLRPDVTGAVQCVGFRPFVHRLAVSECLGGFVRNTGEVALHGDRRRGAALAIAGGLKLKDQANDISSASPPPAEHTLPILHRRPLRHRR